MQIDRLFQIIYILLEKKTVTAKMLSEQFEVSQRTIYRDIDVLSQCGIPLYSARGRNGGIKILENFVLNKSAMTEQEQYHILIALQSLPKGGTENIKETLKKYSNFFQKSYQNYIQVDFSEWGKQKETLFDTLKKAIFDKRVISFVYYNSEGEKTQRKAEPYQLWFKSRNWYLKAYCQEKKHLRIFKLNRIKNLVVTEEFFDKIWKEQENEVNNKLYQDITIVLEIDSSMAYRVYDEFEIEQIYKKQNGDFTVMLYCPENNWIYDYILSWGEYAIVKEPLFVKEKMEQKIKNMIKKYNM